MPESTRRVELVTSSAADGDRTQRVGIGLLLSLVLGAGPLRDAFTGSGAFENAMARFLLCVGASVGAVLLLGWLLDHAGDDEPDATTERPEPETWA